MLNLEIGGIRKGITESFNVHYLFLISLWVFHLINNYIWLKIDTFPLVWDSARHYLVSLSYFEVLSHPSINILQEIADVDTAYPPLAKIAVMPIYAIFGRRPDTAVLAMNSIFLFIIIFSVYFLGRRLYNKNAGILASFIITMYPVVFGQSRWFMLDLSLVAMVSLGIYLLLLTDSFRNRKYSILFGIVSGLGMLAKFTYPIFVMGPLIYILRTESKFIGKQHIINILYSVIFCCLISSVWYVPNTGRFLEQVIYNADDWGELHNLPGIFTMESALYYIINSLDVLSFMSFLLLIVATLYLLKLKSNRVSFLILWIIVPFIIFSLIRTKDLRFIMPSLPAVALISAIGLERINPERIKIILISLIVILASLQYFAISYGIDSTPKNIPLIHFDPPVGTINLFTREIWIVPRVRTDDWKTEEILHTISKDTDHEPVTVLIIPNNPGVSCAIWYESYYRRLPIRIYFAVPDFCLGVSDLCHSPPPNSTYLQFDRVLTFKDEYGFMSLEREMEIINNVQDRFEQHINNFEVIGEIEMPNECYFRECPDEKRPVLLIYKSKVR